LSAASATPDGSGRKLARKWESAGHFWKPLCYRVALPLAMLSEGLFQVAYLVRGHVDAAHGDQRTQARS